MQDIPHKIFPSDSVEEAPRVLLVDDEEEILRSFSRMLRSCDLQTAQGGAVAIQILEKRTDFDVVILDLMMPQTDGPAVLSWIQEHAPHLFDRVILVTAGAFTQRSFAFLTSWKGIVLEKPIRLNTIRRQVAQLFHRSKRSKSADFVA